MSHNARVHTAGEVGYPKELPCCVELFVNVHERFTKWLEFETSCMCRQCLVLYVFFNAVACR